MTQTITCPSGLTGTIRGMKVKEERILADRKLSRSGGQIDHLLAACWQQTVDPGPYDFGEKNIDWGKVLHGDRFFVLLQIRAMTYGPDYAFSVTCPNELCRHRINWELDLTQLPIRNLSDENKDTVINGNRFETILPNAKKKVWFRLLTGADERKLAQMRNQASERLLSFMLSYRVLEIGDVELRDKRAFLEDLSLSDADYLIQAFDVVDCGVETTIEIECPQCLAIHELDLPFDQSFLVPGRSKRTRPPAQSKSFLA